MIEFLAALAVFAAVVFFALYMFLRVPGNRVVEQRIGSLAPSPTQGPDATGVLRRESGTFGFMQPVANSTWAARAAVDLQRAGLAFKVSEYVLLRLLLGTLLAVLALLLTGASMLGFVLAIALALVGWMIPAWYAGMLRGRRINTINAQLVEALQLIANSLRSGFAFTQAVEMANKQLQSPIRDEFERFLQDIQLGAKQDEALRLVAQRTGSYDIDMMVTSILVQRTTGGNLSEILDNVAETIRERERLQGEIRALTASQRLTGIILSIYPIILFFLFSLIAYDLMKVLWEEEFGRILLATAAILQIIGFFVIRRILTLDV